MKKISLFCLFVFSFFFFTLDVNANEKVKVYVFEADGCPYCEAQVEYLENLSSYNTKFEIVRMELYDSHVSWNHGKDYDTAVKVCELFQSFGFNDAMYDATPLVIISDLYASVGYSESLSSFINKAYEEGDKDVVGCIEKGGTNCLNLDSVDRTDDSKDFVKEENGSNKNMVSIDLLYIFGGISFLLLTILIAIICSVKSKKHN